MTDRVEILECISYLFEIVFPILVPKELRHRFHEIFEIEGKDLVLRKLVFVQISPLLSQLGQSDRSDFEKTPSLVAGSGRNKIFASLDLQYSQ